MKKTLRSLAIAALALPLVASAEITMTTVWMNGVVDGVATPIPGLDAGWNKPTPTHQSTSTCSRFGIGKDGKILTTNHITNTIVAWDGKSMSTFAQLPAVTTEKWNGTVLATDDAGNVVFNFNFTDPNTSLQNWGVIGKDGAITEVTLSTPMSELTGHTGRIDIISHIVGDVTSEKGGIGYSTNKGSGQVVMFHFKGNGSKVTSVTAKMSQEVPYLKDLSDKAKYQTETWQPSPKFNTVDQLLQGNPEDNFHLGLGVLSPNAMDGMPSIAGGSLANFENGYAALLQNVGNRFYTSTALVYLGGEKYIVRNYAPADDELLTAWKGVMNFGIFKEDGTLVASWQGSQYTNGFGSETITVETIDENNANIYIYVATGTEDKASGTIGGAYAAMVKVSTEPVAAEPDGTKEHPYEIATADDLCNMWSLMKPKAQTYFVQTADIDMAGIEEYVAPNGNSGIFDCAIHYDGQNHVIKNFAPKDRVAGIGDKAYYCTSVFGVAQGTIKNLGIIDANITVTKFEAGILAAFLGGTWANTETIQIPSSMENVFVIGKIKHTHENDGTDQKPTGGMIGQVAADITLTNCYAQVEVDAKYNAAGIVATLGNTMTLNNCYVSATVKGKPANLVANGGTVVANNVVAFGEGEVPAGVTRYAAGAADGIQAVQAWSAFNQGKLINGLPAFNWQDVSGIYDIAVDEADNAPAVYYNLQGVQVANPENGVYIVRRGNKGTKELIRR